MLMLILFILLASASMVLLYMFYVSLIDFVAKETRSLSYGLMLAAREFAISTQYFSKKSKKEKGEKQRSLDEEFKMRFKKLLNRLSAKRH